MITHVLCWVLLGVLASPTARLLDGILARLLEGLGSMAEVSRGHGRHIRNRWTVPFRHPWYQPQHAA